MIMKRLLYNIIVLKKEHLGGTLNGYLWILYNN